MVQKINLKTTQLILLMLVVTTGMSGFVLSAEDTEEKFQKVMIEGVASARTGPLARALARFKTAVKLKPRSAEAQYRLALTYNDRRMYDSAEKAAQKAVTLDEEHVGAWLVLGSALFYQDMEVAAIEAFNKAFRLDPKNSHAAYMLGRCYYFLGAREKLKAAELNQNPGKLSEEDERKLARTTKNHEEKAQQLLRKAVRYFRQTLILDYNYVSGRFMEGCCFLELDLPDAARDSFRVALLADPDNPEIHFRLGLCYQQASRPLEAERSFQEVLRLDPDHVETHLRLGDYYTNYIPNEKLANYYYGRFLQVSPENHPARRRIAEEPGIN